MSNVPVSKILIAAAKAIALSLVVNVALFFLFFFLKWIDPRVLLGADQQSVTVVHVIFGTTLNLVVATLVFLALVRFTSKPVQIFNWVVLVVFTLMLIPPFITPMPLMMSVAFEILHIPPAYLIWRFLSKSLS